VAPKEDRVLSFTKNDIGEFVEDFDEVRKLGSGFISTNKLEEVDIGDGSVKRPTFVNANLKEEQKRQVHELLKEFIYCLAWDYIEMPGLSKSLVEHQLPNKQGFMPYKQPASNFNMEKINKVKEEVDRLLQAKFI
jgi:hypothetical protein